MATAKGRHAGRHTQTDRHRQRHTQRKHKCRGEELFQKKYTGKQWCIYNGFHLPYPRAIPDKASPPQLSTAANPEAGVEMWGKFLKAAHHLLQPGEARRKSLETPLPTMLSLTLGQIKQPHHNSPHPTWEKILDTPLLGRRSVRENKTHTVVAAAAKNVILICTTNQTASGPSGALLERILTHCPKTTGRHKERYQQILCPWVLYWGSPR